MLDIFFFFFLIITAICLILGFKSKSIPFILLGSVMLIGSGLVLMSEGITMPTTYSLDANKTTIDTNYSIWLGNTCPDVLPATNISHCHTDTSLVIISQIFLYVGILGVLTSLVLLIVIVNRGRA